MNPNYNRSYGFQNLQGTGISDEILASDQYQMITITIDASVRDTGHTGSTEFLRRGLVLYWNTTSNEYEELTLANQSALAVVLAEDIPNMDLSTDPVVAQAYYKATFKKSKLHDDSGLFDVDLCQRISIRDNL